MKLNEDFQFRLETIFRPLQTEAAHSMPSRESLANLLRRKIPKTSTPIQTMTQKEASLFATAAVDMWLRGVHSFLISTALTGASPVWSSVSGYYSSHYSIRGIAHLLGYFYLFKGRTLVHLKIGSRGGCSCEAVDRPRDISGGEHGIYWALVKRDGIFLNDPLFIENSSDQDESDSGHRNFANYTDHLSAYPCFSVLETRAIKERIERISNMGLNDVLIPRRSIFPDVAHVQLVAYHRLVIFRNILDELLGENRFWSVHRNPSFVAGYMDFQAAKNGGLDQLT